MRFVLIVFFILVYIPVQAHAEGVLYVSPDAGTYTIGEIFDIKVLADTGGQKINAAETELTFNPEALQVQKIIVDDSILESWPTPPSFSNEKGIVRFSGWAKNAYQGDSGLLVTIRFKALHNMSSNAYLAAGALLAADSRGSNIITSMKSGLYSVEPTHVDAKPVETMDVVDDTVPTDEMPPEMKKIEADTLPDEPKFDQTTMYVDVGERIVASGTATPNSKVLFFLSKGDEPEKFSAVTSDSEGGFIFVSEQGARDGVYRLRAAVQNVDGQIRKSARLTINARSHGIGAAVGETTDVVSAIAPLITIIVLAGLGAGYLYHMHQLEKIKLIASRRKDRS